MDGIDRTCIYYHLINFLLRNTQLRGRGGLSLSLGRCGHWCWLSVWYITVLRSSDKDGARRRKKRKRRDER